VVPSALRTLSVVTLLSAVSGTVFLVSDHRQGPTVAMKNSSDPVAGVGSTSAALAAVPAPRMQVAAYRQQVPLWVDASQARAEKAAVRLEEARARAEKIKAKARAEAKAEAEKKAKAVAERRAVQARQEVSRSAQRNPQALARIMAADRGWGEGQFSCLRSLWTKESGWNYRAMNPSSGAYGIPQALPGRKMASAGSDWRTNPSTQIEWGLDYIGDRYGTPCGAWGHSQSSGWY
jgi:hypothetical protein